MENIKRPYSVRDSPSTLMKTNDEVARNVNKPAYEAVDKAEYVRKVGCRRMPSQMANRLAGGRGTIVARSGKGLLQRRSRQRVDRGGPAVGIERHASGEDRERQRRRDRDGRDLQGASFHGCGGTPPPEGSSA